MYISPTDLLEISIEDLKNIDEKKIIRLEKKLHILKLQNQDQYFNVNDIDRILTQLKTPKEREVIVFIENHPDFKEFISSGTVNGSDTFKFQETYNDRLENFAPFLDLFIRKYFFQFLKREYNNKNYEIIIASLKNTALFKNETLLVYYEYIEQQTRILIEKITVCPPKQLYEKHPEVTYESLIKLLNVVPYGRIKQIKIDYVKTLVNYFKKTKIFNSEYPKVKNAYLLFSKITVDNPSQEEVLKSLSELGNGRLKALRHYPYYSLVNQQNKAFLNILLFYRFSVFNSIASLLGLIFQLGIIFPLGLLSFLGCILQLIFGDEELSRVEIIDEIKEHINDFITFFKTNPFSSD